MAGTVYCSIRHTNSSLPRLTGVNQLVVVAVVPISREKEALPRRTISCASSWPSTGSFLCSLHYRKMSLGLRLLAAFGGNASLSPRQFSN